MIAAALRTEIDLFCLRALDRADHGSLARCALATQRLTHGDRLAGAEELPTMRLLAELVQRAARYHPATYLAYRALSEHLVAQVKPSSGAEVAREKAFDALDDLVADPTELPVLRSALHTFCEHFQHLCQEATRAPRGRADLTATAA
ncbi:MAG TPA: hypothetical protein VMI75_30845 [Polyangiaceae bacterium]|nr:hypothetical protein [Polyangiaceae bacterium]